MSLYKKCREILFEEFIHRSYRGIPRSDLDRLLSLKVDKAIRYKKERDIGFAVLRTLSMILLRSSSDMSLKESLCRICEALDLDYYILYLSVKRRAILQKHVHYSRTPEMRDRILNLPEIFKYEEWASLIKDGRELVHSPILHSVEQKTSLESKQTLSAGLVWRKAMAPETTEVIKPFLNSFTKYCLDDFLKS